MSILGRPGGCFRNKLLCYLLPEEEFTQPKRRFLQTKPDICHLIEKVHVRPGLYTAYCFCKEHGPEFFQEPHFSDIEALKGEYFGGDGSV